jgi:hypothetical protein
LVTAASVNLIWPAAGASGLFIYVWLNDIMDEKSEKYDKNWYKYIAIGAGAGLAVPLVARVWGQVNYSIL